MTETIKTYEDFWAWFATQADTFRKVVQERTHLIEGFLDKIHPAIQAVNERFYYLVSLSNDIVELVVTPDGDIKTIVFVEEFVASAPPIEGWKFVALKPSIGDIGALSLSMEGYDFSQETLSFYATEHEEYPDEIDITIVHHDFTEEDASPITTGAYVFLDNFLGELNSVTNIDSIDVVGKPFATQELIPIEKLQSYLVWRQKEFVEKYEGTRYDTQHDSHVALQAILPNGKPLLAIINTSLLKWDSTPSHPWILDVSVLYGDNGTSGLPDDDVYSLLEEIEDGMQEELKDFEGYLSIGRQTAEGVRNVYFACKDFRKPSKILHRIAETYADKITIEYEIYKDKYWQSFNRFRLEH